MLTTDSVVSGLLARGPQRYKCTRNNEQIIMLHYSCTLMRNRGPPANRAFDILATLCLQVAAAAAAQAAEASRHGLMSAFIARLAANNVPKFYCMATFRRLWGHSSVSEATDFVWSYERNGSSEFATWETRWCWKASTPPASNIAM